VLNIASAFSSRSRVRGFFVIPERALCAIAASSSCSRWCS